MSEGDYKPKDVDRERMMNKQGPITQNGKKMSFFFTEYDQKVLEQIQGTLKVKRSEAIRTALRVYAAILLKQQP